MAKTALAFNKENIKYLRGFLGSLKVDTFLSIGDEPDRGTYEDWKICEMVKECLEQMEKYGDNRWWLSKDKRVIGYYQLMNPCLLVSFQEFHEALEFLLGRSVWPGEIGENSKALKDEAERAFKGRLSS